MTGRHASPLAEVVNRVAWAPARSGGFVGGDLEGRVFRVQRARYGRGYDVYWLHVNTRATWVCRSVTAESACAKLDAIIKRENDRKAT